MFPMHKPAGKLSKKYRTEIKEKIKGLIIFKLCYVSRNAFDSIFISYFLGLVDIAIYKILFLDILLGKELHQLHNILSFQN